MGHEQKSLWVGSLPCDVSEEELREKFEACGRVADVFIQRRADDASSQLYGFVHFLEAEGFRKAMRLSEEELMLRGHGLKVRKGHGGWRSRNGWQERSSREWQWEKERRWDTKSWHKAGIKTRSRLDLDS